MQISDLLIDFSTAVSAVSAEITGSNSIYDKTLLKFNEIYAESGMTSSDRAKAITEVSAQLAVSTTNAIISTAADFAKNVTLIDSQIKVELAKVTLINNQANSEIEKKLEIIASTKVKNAQKLFVDNQAATELKKALDVVGATLLKNAQKLLANRQEQGYNDKLLVEAMRSMSGVAQMQASTGTSTVAVLTASNKTIDVVLSAGGSDLVISQD